MEDLRDLELTINRIVDKLRSKKGVLIAFSGGVDSSVVALLAHLALGDDALAVTISSPLLPFGELEDAIEVAKLIGVKHLVIELNELEEPGFSDNPPDRCYICKKARFKRLKEVASKEGLEVIVDGTNSSDLLEHRPGLRAAVEEGVYSPLLEEGLTKSDVRELARYLNLPNHDKPPSSCLATRVPYGQRLTLDRLRRIDQAEKVVKSLVGASIVRVRDHGDLARIEVATNERRLFFDEGVLDSISKKLKELGFKYVTLDLEGYKKGVLRLHQ